MDSSVGNAACWPQLISGADARAAQVRFRSSFSHDSSASPTLSLCLPVCLAPSRCLLAPFLYTGVLVLFLSTCGAALWRSIHLSFGRSVDRADTTDEPTSLERQYWCKTSARRRSANVTVAYGRGRRAPQSDHLII